MSVVIYIYTTDNSDQKSYENDLKELKSHRVFFYPANYKENYEAIKNSPKLRLNYLPTLLIIEKAEDGQDTISVIEGDRVRKWLRNEQEIEYQKEKKENYAPQSLSMIPPIAPIAPTVSPAVVSSPQAQTEPQCVGDVCAVPSNITISAPDILPTDVDDGITKFAMSGKKVESHLNTISSSSYITGENMAEKQKSEEKDLRALSGQDIDDGQQPYKKLTQKQKDMRSMVKMARDMQEERDKESSNLPPSLRN